MICNICHFSKTPNAFAWTDARKRTRRQTCRSCRQARERERKAKAKKNEPKVPRGANLQAAIRDFAASRGVEYWRPEKCAESICQWSSRAVLDGCWNLLAKGALESNKTDRVNTGGHEYVMFRAPQPGPRALACGRIWGFVMCERWVR